MDKEKPQFSVISEEQLMPKNATTSEPMASKPEPMMEEMQPKAVDSMFSRKMIWSGVIFLFFFTFTIMLVGMYRMAKDDIYYNDMSEDSLLYPEDSGIEETSEPIENPGIAPGEPNPNAPQNQQNTTTVDSTVESIQSEIDAITSDLQESDISDTNLGL